MKKYINKKIIVSIIIFLVLIIIGGVCYFINNKNDDFIVGETLKINEYSDYLVQYDNGDYYLMKVNEDIKFEVSSEEETVKYKIVDENDKKIESNVTKDNKNYVISANKNYEAGKTYKITLENAIFTDEKLKDIKTLYFTIVRPNSNTQVLNDNVIKVNSNVITKINEDDNYYTITSSKEFKNDDILYYQNKDQVIAFKVSDIKKEKDNYIIKTNAPTLEELFKELDIYGEFNLKLDNFVSNEELKDYIEVAIVENGLLDSIIPSVNAEDIFDVDVNYQKDGSAKVLVSINLNHGNKSVFKNTLENHDMKLDIELIVRLKAHADITLFHHDIGASLDIDINTDFNINPIENEEYKFNFDENINDDLNIQVGLFKDALTNAKNDTSKDDITLGKMIIPTPILGLSVDLEMDLIKELELVLKADFKFQNNFNILFGHNDKGFYKNFDFSVKDSSYDVLGKAEAKIGLNPKVNINFCRIMEAGIEAPLGVYADGQINYMNSSNKNQIDGKMEIGTFVNAGLYAETHFIYAKVEATYEKKLPIITLEGKIKDKCEEQVLNGDYSCFIGTYTSNYADDPTKTIDKNGINIDYYRMSDGQKDGRAKLENIKVENGIYYLTYDIGYFIGQQASVYEIVPIGVEYEAVNGMCEKCKSNEDNCRYEASNEEYFGTCYYNTDKNKLRIIGSELGSPIIYYKD